MFVQTLNSIVSKFVLLLVVLKRFCSISFFVLASAFRSKMPVLPEIGIVKSNLL